MAAPSGPRVLSFYMFEESLSEFGFRMGYGAAIAVVLFFIMLGFIAYFLYSMWRDQRGHADVSTAIQQTSRPWQIAYQLLLPGVLIIWLLPLLAVALFSIKPSDDFASGNFWGLPSSFEGLRNYGRVFFDSDMPQFLLNSVLITVPTTLWTVILSAMTGFTLAIYRFRSNLWIFFIFIAGNFVPFRS